MIIKIKLKKMHIEKHKILIKKEVVMSIKRAKLDNLKVPIIIHN